MIFVSLGTHQQGFPRAMKIVSGLDIGEEVIAQTGETPATSAPGLTCIPYMEYDEVRTQMRQASCVICHAGVGTVLTALEAGHKPIVIPRLRVHGEHIDDHQLQLSLQLSSRGLILCYRDGESLTAMVQSAQGQRGSSHRGNDALGLEIARDVAATPARPARGGLITSARSLRPMFRR